MYEYSKFLYVLQFLILFGGSMRKLNKIICFALFFLVFACGESERDISSRLEISGSIRQLNTTFSDLKENQNTEESLNLLKTRDYYSDYLKQFRKIRSELAGKPITEKFTNLIIQIDSILVKSTLYIGVRQKNMLNLFEINSNFNRYLDYMKDAEEYKTKSYGSDYYTEYLSKALEEAGEFSLNKIQLELSIINQNAIIKDLINDADSLNYCLKKLKFTDTLKYNKVLLDTTDVIHSGWRAIESIPSDVLMDKIEQLIGSD